MALTDTEKQEIKQSVLNDIKADSTDLGELESVTSLDGLTSLPAMSGDKLVSAPIALLSQPAEDAAAKANTAAEAAESATTAAETATTAAETATEKANAAATAAETAAASATQVVETYGPQVETALAGTTLPFDGIETSSLGYDTTNTYDEAPDSVLWCEGLGKFVGVYAAIRATEFGTKDLYMNGDTPSKGKLYLYNGTVYVWNAVKKELAEASGGGQGSGYYNVTQEIPLASGYYTLATAVAAVATADIDDEDKPGMIITFETAAGKWSDYRYVGSSTSTWGETASWEEYGGGKIKSITLNGVAQTPNDAGNVTLTVDQVEVDESLDAASTNPVQNAAVTAKMTELEANTIYGSNAELSDDETTVRVTLTNKSGGEVTAFDIPAGSGSGGSGESSTTKVVLTAATDHSTIKEGSNVTLTYNVDHQYSSGDEKGESTGQKLAVTVSVLRGSTTVYNESYTDVSKGSYTIDLSDYLLSGTNDIYVVATATDPLTGKTQKKQAYTSVKVVTLTLTSTYDLGEAAASGGYGDTRTVSIPYTVNGTGTKVVTLYVDGVQKDTATITRSGTTNGSFAISAATLTAGKHDVQMVAEMEAGGGLVLRSESLYMTILKAGGAGCYVGLGLTNASGAICESGATPTVEAGQYRSITIRYMAYDPDTTPAAVTVAVDGAVTSTLSAPRSEQQMQWRSAEKGSHTIEIACGDAKATLQVDVVDSGIDIAKAEYGLVAEWKAEGRSNSEEEPGQWTSGEYDAEMTGFDWSSNGWIDGTLKLTNGAKCVLNYPLFKAEAAATGLTIEMEIKVSNVSDRDYSVLSCMDGDKGLRVTTQEASIKTGTKQTYVNEDGETTTRDVEIGTKYAADNWLKIGFTVQKKTDNRLMEMYINGELSSADVYDNSYSFVQETPAMITIQSEEADVEVRNIRIYNRWLDDDEMLENYMADRTDADEMLELYDDNNVIGETGDVDIDTLRKRGHGVMRFVRAGGLDELNETNNKKTDFESDIYFYSPFGQEYDFVLKGCYVRIQGTSSTKYPRKNYRIYMNKGGESLALYVNGVLQTDVDSKGKVKNKYTMRPGSKANNLYCMKADYSDSSMTHNTGVAKLHNDVMKELGLLTPPQQWEYEQGGSLLSAITVRSAIDGFPIDIFSSETADGESMYYGQYNFNNEKSKSGELFGMEGVDGYTPACPITLEMLNNTEKVCLFQSESDEDLQANFDNGCEFNYPEDTFALEANVTANGKGSVWSDAQATACKRLWGWIRECKPANADVNDISTWNSEKFAAELDNYFDRQHLCTWYVHTDYFMEVDQRAKNMLLRTWDGLKWFITYYDGDTALGRRNDSFLVYDYTLTRDTYDASASKFAFEGRDSWLWNLLLANCEDDIKAAAAEYRTKMTNKRVLAMLNEEQMGNWSKRQYNKSGIFKYVTPAIETTYGRQWPFIYALKGSCETHRTYIWTNRAALLDAKYGTADFRADLIDCYVSRTAADADNTIVVEGNEQYAYGYGTINHPNEYNTGIIEAGERATLTIGGARTINDPIRIYGASRMTLLDMSGISDNIKNALDLSMCTSLRELNLSSSKTGSTGWYMIVNNCKQLRRLNLNSQAQARTGSSTSTELDLSNQIKLQWLDAGSTEVQSVVLAKGAPVTYAKLPATLKTLRLEYLPKLEESGLVMEGTAQIETMIFDSCPLLDWETIVASCPNVKRLRVTGIDKEDDGTWLEQWMNIGGVDASGNVTDTCALVGTVQLTTYLDEDKYAEIVAHYPELNVLQPEYTVLERDESVTDDANVSNLDNKTGYKYGTAYVPSGHVAKILAKRHRCLGKITEKGVMTLCQLHDDNSNYYADGLTAATSTPAKLDGSEGDWLMYEPHAWFKGVNDYLNKKLYSCYSSNETKPKEPKCDVKTLEDLQADTEGYTAGVKLMSGYATLTEAMASDKSYSVLRVDVSQHKRVRWPTVVGTNFEVSAFVAEDASTVIETVSANALSNKFENGMYLIYDVPEGAKWLYLTIYNSAEFDYVVLSNSDKIEDMEPYWVEKKEDVGAVAGSTVSGDKLRSCISGGSTTGNMTWTNFNYYSAQRGMQQIDYAMHRWIANLFYAKYGRRDAQMQCGAGSNTNSRTTGGTAALGMQDTVNTDGTTTGGWEGNGKAWYTKTDTKGNVTYASINNTNCLGYEDIYGHKCDMMDNVKVNAGTVDGKWTITEPDGTVRKVKGATSSAWIAAVAHGRYMDVVPVGTMQASSSTGYCDMYYYGGAVDRVVYRGFDYANASGGVSSAYASTGASNAYSNIGSRLAFRGKIVWTSSVTAYKALSEIS
jgi:hypothetical protein